MRDQNAAIEARAGSRTASDRARRGHVFAPEEDFGHVFGEPADPHLVVGAGEPGAPFDEKLTVPHHPVAEANRRDPNLDEEHLDGQHVVEPGRGAVTEVDVDDREMHTAGGPIGVGDASTAEPLDPSHLEIHHVAPVMDDPHQVGLVEADANRNLGARERRIDRVGKRCHGRAATSTPTALLTPSRRWAIGTGVTTKRRLPVIQEPKGAPKGGSGNDADEGDEERPPWQWGFFGAVAIFFFWLPGSMIAQALATRLVGDPQAAAAHGMGAIYLKLVLPHAVALALASVGGGFIVGKFGGKAGTREAVMAGVFVTVVAAVLTFAASGFSWVPFSTVILTAPFAALGARIGLKRRK